MGVVDLLSGGTYKKWLIFTVLVTVSLYLFFLPMGLDLSVSNRPIESVATPVSPPPSNITTNTTENTTPQYKVYFFEQPNCEYCTIMHPRVAAEASKYNASINYIDISKNRALATQYNVVATPTTIVTPYSSSTVLSRWIGEFDVQELDQWLQPPQNQNT